MLLLHNQHLPNLRLQRSCLGKNSGWEAAFSNLGLGGEAYTCFYVVLGDSPIAYIVPIKGVIAMTGFLIRP